MKQSKNWIFTDHVLLDWERLFETTSIVYVCWGKEICPKTDREHYQGWFQLGTKDRFETLKLKLGCVKLHLEAMRGTQERNQEYCKKDGEWRTLGDYVKQGQMKGVSSIYKAIEEKNVSELEISRENPEVHARHYRAFRIKRCLEYESKSRERRDVEVIVYQGLTGFGKSRKALYDDGSRMMKEDVYLIDGNNLQWFDGYEGQNTMVIDEYANDVKITWLMRLLDGNQLRLPVKGGFTYALWNKVVITTNLDWESWHPNAKLEHREAVQRRITRWRTFKKRRRVRSCG